jgi:hypothetical protein
MCTRRVACSEGIPREVMGVELEQVAGQDRVRLRPQNCAQVDPIRRGAGLIPAACRMVQMVEAPIW